MSDLRQFWPISASGAWNWTDFEGVWKLSPSYKEGHLSYQFPVQIEKSKSDHERYKLRANYQNDLLITKDVLAIQNRTPKDNLYDLNGQRDFSFWQHYVFCIQSALVPSWSFVRLVYYGYDIKPRIWIRSPGTSKGLINSITDFVPIYSERPNANVTNTLEFKLREARICAPLTLKLKENQEIMERLNRL